jgi:prevent-host-death family protein
MSEIGITEARGRLATLVDEARKEPVFLTRRNRPVAVLIDADEFARLRELAEDAEDAAAAAAAREEMAATGALPVPWDEVKAELGLA